MTTHRITVTVDPRAIRVDPETLVMTSQDEVHWSGTNSRAFSIVFDHQGPFGERELPHDRALSRLRPRSKGHFKYSVVSGEDPAVRLDPVIIVEDPPTGQTP